MTSKMELADVGIGFIPQDYQSKFKHEPGQTHIWHVARKMTSLWMEDKTARFYIFHSGYRGSSQDSSRELIDPVEASEASDIDKNTSFS
jgi:hypothetical protein